MVAETQKSSDTRTSETPKHSWKSFLPGWKLTSPHEDPGALLKQRAVIAAMNRDELLDGLQQLTELDLDEELENDLRFSLLSCLAPLDPATTLTLADSLSDQGSLKIVNFKLKTFKFLSQQDTVKAAEWLDQKIADESFKTTRIHGGDNPRFKFEKVLISSLLDSNFLQAQARVSGFNDQEKIWLFSNDSEHWLQGDIVPEGFLSLARENFSSEMAAAVIGIVLGTQKVASLADATTLLDQSKLSESERGYTARNLLLNHLGQEYKVPDFEEVYRWAQAEDPGRSIHLMTDVFNRSGSRKTEEIIASVFSLVDATGDQSILDNYLKYRTGLGDESLQREIDSFKDQELAQRFRSALQR